jgi:hypothetical protein
MPRMSVVHAPTANIARATEVGNIAVNYRKRLAPNRNLAIRGTPLTCRQLT